MAISLIDWIFSHNIKNIIYLILNIEYWHWHLLVGLIDLILDSVEWIEQCREMRMSEGGMVEWTSGEWMVIEWSNDEIWGPRWMESNSHHRMNEWMNGSNGMVNDEGMVTLILILMNIAIIDIDTHIEY